MRRPVSRPASSSSFFNTCRLVKIKCSFCFKYPVCSDQRPQPRSLHSVPQRNISGFSRFPANESIIRTGLRFSLSEKSSFCLPAFEISHSCRTASDLPDKTGLARWRRMPLFFHLFSLSNRYIHTSFIHKHTADPHLHIFTAVGSVGGTSMWCRAEIRASALPIEPRCTLVPNCTCGIVHIVRFMVLQVEMIACVSGPASELHTYLEMRKLQISRSSHFCSQLKYLNDILLVDVLFRYSSPRCLFFMLHPLNIFQC